MSDYKIVATWPIGVTVMHEVKIPDQSIVYVQTDSEGNPVKVTGKDGRELTDDETAAIKAAIGKTGLI